MTTISLPRRAVIGTVLAASLVAAGVSALASTAGGCPSWTDPKGDATTGGEPTGVAADAQLDILKASFGTVGDSLVGTITTDALGDSSSDAGDEYRFAFKVAGVNMLMYVDRIAPDGFEVDVTAGFYNLDTDETADATAKFDPKSKTVTITGKVSELAKAAGKAVAGQPVSALAAETGDHLLGQPVFDYDAAPTKLQPVVGKPCGSTSAAPAASPAASPKPSSSPSPSPSPSASSTATAAPGAPIPGCVTFGDPKGDASVGPLVDGPGVAEPDLDITGLVLQATPDTFRSITKVDKLASRPQSTPGHSFYTYFTVNKKAVALIATAYDPAAFGDAQDGLAAATAGTPAARSPQTRMTVDGALVTSTVKSVFDVKTSTVTITIPRAELAKAVGGLADGATLTKVYARNSATTPAGGLFVDSTAKDNSTGATDKEAWKVGDNKCFAAATSPLSSVGVTKAQYADMAPVAARLLDAAGKPVAGKSVTFQLGSERAFATTAKNGVAKAKLLVRETAGRRVLRLTADGLTRTVPFTVLVERTTLTADGSGGAVTATLKDDDRNAVALQLVTFTSGSRKVTARTDASGFAEVSGFPRGAVVKVSYAGVSGRYSAASTSTSA